MSRAPWNNESRICRWPHDGFSSGPTKEERLRKKYPDLQKKWKKYVRCDKIYNDIITQESNISVKKTFGSPSNKKLEIAFKNLEKAKKDYEFLKKMLWDY